MKTAEFIKARTFLEKAESLNVILAVLTEFKNKLAYDEALQLFDLAIERIEYVYQKRIAHLDHSPNLLPFEK